jgi:RNA polymerase sigma-70 factor (ECF subfamily)
VHDIKEIYNRNFKTVWNVCFGFMKNIPDTQDCLQDTFRKLIQSGKQFESTDHEKAWLIKTAGNICRNELKHSHRKTENIDDYGNLTSNENFEIGELLQTVLKLPENYRNVIYLYYYEEYSCKEISRILKKPEGTVKYYLSKAREQLKGLLGEDYEF